LDRNSDFPHINEFQDQPNHLSIDIPDHVVTIKTLSNITSISVCLSESNIFYNSQYLQRISYNFAYPMKGNSPRGIHTLQIPRLIQRFLHSLGKLCCFRISCILPIPPSSCHMFIDCFSRILPHMCIVKQVNRQLDDWFINMCIILVFVKIDANILGDCTCCRMFLSCCIVGSRIMSLGKLNIKSR